MSMFRIAGLFVLSLVFSQGALAQSLCGQTTTNGTGQGYISAVTLTCDTTLTDSGNGPITFNSTVDGAYGLTVNTGGSIYFFDAVGSLTALTSLYASGNNFPFVSNVRTTGAITLISNGSVLNTGGASLDGGSITLTGSGGITLNGLVTTGGALQLNSTNAAITQAASTLMVFGNTSVNAGSGAITLTNASNFFIDAVSLTGGDVQVANHASLILGNVNASGNLQLTTINAPISQAGAVAVTGTASINAGSGAITLTNAGNLFGGAVSLANSGANPVALANSGPLTLGTVAVGDSLALTALSVSNPTSVTFGGGATGSSVTGDYSQTGTLNLHAIATNADHLGITGNANLGGTLSVAFSPPPPSGGGLLAVVLSAGGNINGTFSNFNVSGLAAGQTASLIYNAHTVQISVQSPPIITTSSGSAAFIAGDNTASTPVAIDPGLTVTDAGSATLASATVVIIGNFHAGEDVLAFSNDGATMGNIASSYNALTGVLTLTSASATATIAQWQNALRSITFTDTAITPDTATRMVSFSAVDAGLITSNIATRTVTVAATDQTPIVTTMGITTNYVFGSPAITIDAGIAVSDLDNTTQSSATVAVTTGFHNGDVLGFVNTSSAQFGNIVASYNAATGVMTMTSAGATATNAQWANALSSVTFSSTSSTGGNRTIAFAVNDGTKTSVAATDTVNAMVVQAQAITNFIANPANPIFVPGGTGTFAVSATGGASGNPVTFSSATSAVCTAAGTNGATITMLSPGACTLHADQAGNMYYTMAPQVTLNVTIVQAAQTLSIAAPTGIYVNLGPATVTATASSGLPVTVTSTTPAICTVSGTAPAYSITLLAPGTCTLTATQAGDTNYAPVAQNVSFNVLAQLVPTPMLDRRALLLLATLVGLVALVRARRM